MSYRAFRRWRCDRCGVTEEAAAGDTLDHWGQVVTEQVGQVAQFDYCGGCFDVVQGFLTDAANSVLESANG